MRWPLIALFLLSSISVSAQTPALTEPGISPDGREVAFVSGGDIWTVPAAGGEARLLVSDPAMEARPLYLPDGKMLAFTSTRTGNGDVYVLDFAGGAIRRLTWDDSRDQVDGWSRDGKWIYFSSTSRDISGMNDLWRVPAGGGTPMQVSAERYVNEFFAAPSPDGKSIAFNARGIASGQWWRHGHSHIDETQIWILRDATAHTYEPVTADGAKEMWPMWAADGQRIYYISDRSGSENIWSTPIGGKPAQITKFDNGRARWPSISIDGKTIVFERDFGLWRLDTASGAASQIAVALRGVPAAVSIDHRRLTDRFSDLALSPDGKKFASPRAATFTRRRRRTAATLPGSRTRMRARRRSNGARTAVPSSMSPTATARRISFNTTLQPRRKSSSRPATATTTLRVSLPTENRSRFNAMPAT